MAAGAWDKTAAIVAGIRSALGDNDAHPDAYHPYKAKSHFRRERKRFIQQQKGNKP